VRVADDGAIEGGGAPRGAVGKFVLVAFGFAAVAVASYIAADSGVDINA